MAPDIVAVLTARFIVAMRQSFSPCPLIGPKWFRHHPDGKPADFQFVGVSKLAKALRRQPADVAEMIVRNLDLKGIEANIDVAHDAINVRLKQRPQE